MPGRYDNLEISCLADALERLDGRSEPNMGDFEDVFRELSSVLELILEPHAAAASHSMMMACREYRNDEEKAPSAKEVEDLCAAWDVDSIEDLKKKAKDYIEVPFGVSQEEAGNALDAVAVEKQGARDAAAAAEAARLERENADAVAEVRVEGGKKQKK